MDVIMEYEDGKAIVDVWGWEGFVNYFEDQFNYRFFTCSQYWYDDSQYICKMKGANGDIIIGWQGIHD